jgi:hypothetical protein
LYFLSIFKRSALTSSFGRIRPPDADPVTTPTPRKVLVLAELLALGQAQVLVQEQAKGRELESGI